MVDVACGPPREIKRAKGDLVEKELFQELKKFYSTASDQEVVVYHGPEIRKPVVPSHANYESLVESLAFVVLSQPISTYCTIASDVHDKVVGKPAMQLHKKKAMANQEDFTSIIFKTNDQAKIRLAVLQFVFFISPW